MNQESRNAGKVPVLGVPVYNRVDLLLRLLRSIDFPVHRLVLINNGQIADLDEQVDAHLNDHCPPWIDEIDTHEPDGNLGVAGAWNYLLHQYCDDYVLICNNDIAWTPGDLEKMHLTVRANREFDAVFGNWSYSNFIITAKGVETIGYFDENFWPAYFEDGDHWRRIVLSRANICHAVGVNAQHGEDGAGSCTIKADPELAQRNAITQAKNEAYYRRKWGWGGEVVRETHQFPWNNPGLPLRYWQLMPEGFDRPYYLPDSSGERHAVDEKQTSNAERPTSNVEVGAAS